MSAEQRTWHHGLVARWWGQVEQGGDDIARFQQIVMASGTPALDAGAGSGRCLLPLLDAGLDVDASDTSADMLAWCRAGAEARGHHPRLFHQAMHELDTGRRYRTVIMVGAFGIGGTRAEDLEGLRRMHAHLLPGGVLAFDLHLPTGDPRGWQLWLQRQPLPSKWRPMGGRQDAGGDGELQLWGRLENLDPLQQRWTRGIRVEHWRDQDLVAEESYSLSGSSYLLPEVLLMLEVAGFGGVEVFGGMEERAAEPWRDPRLLLLARA